MLSITTRILEEQEKLEMQTLGLFDLSGKPDEEPTEEDKLLINAVIRSGLTQLTELFLSGSIAWFANTEIRSYLLEFIQE